MYRADDVRADRRPAPGGGGPGDLPDLARGESRDLERRLAGDEPARRPAGSCTRSPSRRRSASAGSTAAAGRVDDERGKLYFSPRKARSAWAASNKARVERLIASGRMMPAGLAAIERAKANGSWDLLTSVERLEVPDDLAAGLGAAPGTGGNWAEWAAWHSQAGPRLHRPRAPAGDPRPARREDRRPRHSERPALLEQIRFRELRPRRGTAATSAGASPGRRA